MLARDLYQMFHLGFGLATVRASYLLPDSVWAIRFPKAVKHPPKLGTPNGPERTQEEDERGFLSSGEA